jgi:hypothetical protein
MAVAAAVLLVAVWPERIHFTALFISTASFVRERYAIGDGVSRRRSLVTTRCSCRW